MTFTGHTDYNTMKLYVAMTDKKTLLSTKNVDNNVSVKKIEPSRN